MNNYYLIGYRDKNKHNCMVVETDIDLARTNVDEAIEAIKQHYSDPTYLVFVHSPLMIADVVYPDYPTREMKLHIEEEINVLLDYLNERS